MGVYVFVLFLVGKVCAQPGVTPRPIGAYSNKEIITSDGICKDNKDDSVSDT